MTVVAPDRSGLLAEVTGVLALHGLNVRSADGGRGGRRRRRDLHRRAVPGPVAGGGPPGRRPGRGHGRNPVHRGPRWPSGPGPTGANAGPSRRTWCRPRSRWTTTPPPPPPWSRSGPRTWSGQLHRITRALVDCQLDVISAKVSTFGSAVVDAFYVRGPDGGKVTDAGLIETVEATISRPGSAERRRQLTGDCRPPLAGTGVQPVAAETAPYGW